MADIEMMVLGAGQEVGRSCVVMHIEGTYIMFDCGMHLGFKDARRFPDFTLLPFHERMTEMITAVVITHFHLDHCAALPYFTEVHGYHGPIYMTYPTRAIMPIMLEDYLKVMTDRQGDRQWYSRQHIAACMQRVIGVDLGQVVQVAPGVRLCALYAGHVLGAAMFHLTVGTRTVLYTGDYNTSPDRHLSSAQVGRLRPDLLVSEATYATTIRDGRTSRERDLISEVVRVVGAGGKVLIPVNAVGRAQELLVLVGEAWARLGLAGRVPMYLAGAMAGRANALYRACTNWAHPQVREAGARRAAFSFDSVAPWDPALVDAPGPCLLFASPGMLNGGASLHAFKAWAPGPANLVLLPGYQVAGTVGGKLMSGAVTELKLGSSVVHVRCQVRYLSFSAHADAGGILRLVAAAAPRHVALVHGDRSGMDFLGARITRMLGVPCSAPANGDWVRVRTSPAAQPLRCHGLERAVVVPPPRPPLLLPGPQGGPCVLTTGPESGSGMMSETKSVSETEAGVVSGSNAGASWVLGGTCAEDTGEAVEPFPVPVNGVVVAGVVVGARGQQGAQGVQGTPTNLQFMPAQVFAQKYGGPLGRLLGAEQQ